MNAQQYANAAALRTETTSRSALHFDGLNLYDAEASALGYAPGYFPDVITVDPEGEHPIEFHVLRFTRVHGAEPTATSSSLLGTHIDHDGDLMAQDYVSRLGGFYLRLFND